MAKNDSADKTTKPPQAKRGLRRLKWLVVVVVFASMTQRAKDTVDAGRIFGGVFCALSDF